MPQGWRGSSASLGSPSSAASSQGCSGVAVVCVCGGGGGLRA